MVPDPVCTPGKPHVVIDMDGINRGLVTGETADFVRTGRGNDVRFWLKTLVWVVDEDAPPYDVAPALPGQDAPAADPAPIPHGEDAAPVVASPGPAGRQAVSNADRADWAMAAVDQHGLAARTDPDLDDELKARDLLTDFMHLCGREGWDFPSLVQRATEVHEEELREGLPLQTYRILVTRKRVVRERGYLTVEAPDEDAALEVAYGMEDPNDMSIYSDEIEDLQHVISG